MTLSLDDVKKMKVQVLLSVTLISSLPHMSLQSCVTDVTSSTIAQGRNRGLLITLSSRWTIVDITMHVFYPRVSIDTLVEERCSSQELRDELTKRGLDSSGLKAALAERLEESMKSDADATAPNGANASTEPAQPAADLQAATNGSAVSHLALYSR